MNIPLKESVIISLGAIYKSENILIKIHTDSGLTGTVEASPLRQIIGEIQASEFEIAKHLAAVIKYPPGGLHVYRVKISFILGRVSACAVGQRGNLV